MNAADAIRRAIATTETLLAEQQAVLAAIEGPAGGAPMAAPVEAMERTVEVGAAMTITRKSSTWLYKNAKRFGFGYRLASGSWLFSEPRVRAFMAGRTMAREENEMFEKNEAAPLALAHVEEHDSSMEVECLTR